MRSDKTEEAFAGLIEALKNGEDGAVQEALDILEYTKKATEVLGQLHSISRKVDNILGTEEETK